MSQAEGFDHGRRVFFESFNQCDSRIDFERLRRAIEISGRDSVDHVDAPARITSGTADVHEI